MVESCPTCNGTGIVMHESANAATQTPLPVSDATQFKVGDWVELTDGLQCCLTECLNPDSGHWLAKKVDGSEVSVWEKNSVRTIARTIQKSEVVVTIGCLSGTIGKSSETTRFLMWHSSPKIDFDYSIIKFSALDTATLEIVQSLLKAQEE